MVELTVPPPETVHVKAGWEAIAVLNWSNSLAENCLAVPSATVAVAGDTTMLLAVCCTVTSTVLVVNSPPPSVTVI